MTIHYCICQINMEETNIGLIFVVHAKCEKLCKFQIYGNYCLQYLLMLVIIKME